MEHRIDELVKKNGMTYTELAERTGMSRSYLSKIRNGEKRLNITTMQRLASALDCKPEDIIGRKLMIPVVGYIGAGHQVFTLEPESVGVMDEVEAPPGADGDMAALRVRGNSMFPVYHEGDILFYRVVCNFDESYLNRDCVVKVENGLLLVKRLRRGNSPGRFHLESYNAPALENHLISWACPVLWVKKA